VSKKPRIEITDVFEIENILAVRYKFDTGETGQVNFHLDATEEQIRQTLERIYERTQRLKHPEMLRQREALKAKLKGLKIQ